MKGVYLSPGMNAFHYLVNTFLTLLMGWIDHDLPYAAERRYDRYRQLTQPGVEAILRQLV